LPQCGLRWPAPARSQIAQPLLLMVAQPIHVTATLTESQISLESRKTLGRDLLSFEIVTLS